MIPEPNLTAFNLNYLRRRCATESDRFFDRLSHDPRYCYELFRRALLEKDQLAWECVYEQYQPLVSGWVKRHSIYAATGEEAEYFVNEAFSRLWRVITPEKFTRFEDLKSILAYLQMCVNGCLVDYMRSRDRANVLEEDPQELGIFDNSEDPDPEEQIQEQAQVEQLWGLLKARLKNEQEELIVYACFVLALKPSQVMAEYPAKFRNVQEIYRIKDNLLARLRRDADFMEILSRF